MAGHNRRILFKSRPHGLPEPGDFELVENPVPTPDDDEILIRNLYLSLDPYMRGRMSERKSYVAGFKLGEPLEGGVVGRVVKSRHERFQAGDYVTGLLRWEDYSISDGKGLLKVDPAQGPLSAYLGILGMPGLTAYVGLLDVGQPKAGETVFVSAASGAVGQVVGQIARLKGCRVAGTVGSAAKVRYCLDELGFDACFDYKTAGSLREAFKQSCPDGIDVLFENVGGAIFDTALTRLNLNARVALCGMIADYNAPEPYGLKNLGVLIVNRASITGFLVSDHYHRTKAFVAEMGQWLREGRVRYREDISEGLENAPKAFIGMLQGENFGKTLVKIADE